jgi:hypothetical protein
MNEAPTVKKNPARTRAAAAAALDLLGPVLAIIGCCLSRQENGMGMFRFYTEDSNILAAAAGLISAAFGLAFLTRGRAIPRRVLLLKYTGVCCLMVTFTVVLGILAPMAGAGGYWVMLTRGSMLYHHLLCPLLALVSFLLTDGCALSRRDTLLPLIPTALYAAVTVVLNLARVMVGPYPFLRVYEQPVWLSCVWVAVILGGAWVLAALLRAASAALARRRARS